MSSVTPAVASWLMLSSFVVSGGKKQKKQKKQGSQFNEGVREIMSGGSESHRATEGIRRGTREREK